MCLDNTDIEAAAPHHDNRKLLSAWINITVTSTTAPSENNTSLRTANIGNFDINFDISSDNASD